MSKIITKNRKSVNFNNETEISGTEFASLTLNPLVTFAKFILTDDAPNGNKHRIPAEEFDNIIKTGVYMPVKMAEGGISPGHEGTKPIGVITHLKKEETPVGSRVVALAALWGLERPEDVEYIKQKMEEDGEVDVSWEVSFRSLEIEPNGVKALHDVILNAATIVGNPAYQGRTKFLAVAAIAEPWSEAYIDELPDDAFLYIEAGGILDSDGKTLPRSLRKFPIKDKNGFFVAEKILEAAEEIKLMQLPEDVSEGVHSKLNTLLAQLDANTLPNPKEEIAEESQEENKNTEVELDTLEQVKAEYENQIVELKSQLETSKSEFDAVKAELDALKQEKELTDEELKSLREFKAEVERQKELELRVAGIKQKFLDAGLEKDAEYFDKNMEMLLGLEESALDFFIQELVAFQERAEASIARAGVPTGIVETGVGKLSPKELANALKQRKAK